MDADTELIFELMRVFDGIDSSRRKLGVVSAGASGWHPIGEKEEAAFKALTALENRAALKKWYSGFSSINQAADAFRRILEQATGEELPVGTS
jgi:hypothetical protein